MYAGQGKKLNLGERETESYGQDHCRELSQGGDFHLPGELPAHPLTLSGSLAVVSLHINIIAGS